MKCPKCKKDYKDKRNKKYIKTEHLCMSCILENDCAFDYAFDQWKESF